MSETKTPKTPKTSTYQQSGNKTPISPIKLLSPFSDLSFGSIGSNVDNSFSDKQEGSKKISFQISEAIVNFCIDNDEEIIKEKFKAGYCIFEDKNEFENELFPSSGCNFKIKEERDSPSGFTSSNVDLNLINLDAINHCDITHIRSQCLLRYYIGQIVYDIDDETMNGVMLGVFPEQIIKEIKLISEYGRNKSEKNSCQYFQNISFYDESSAHAMLLLCTATEVFLYDSNGFATQQILGGGEKYEYDVKEKLDGLLNSFSLDDLNEVDSVKSEYNESSECINMNNHIQSIASCFNTDLTLTFLFFEMSDDIKECIRYLDQKNEGSRPNLDILASNLISVIKGEIKNIVEGSLVKSPSWIKLPDSPSTDGKTGKYRLRFF